MIIDGAGPASEPVGAFVVGVAMLGEPLNFMRVLATALIVLGIVLMIDPPSANA